MFVNFTLEIITSLRSRFMIVNLNEIVKITEYLNKTYIS